MSKEPSLPPIAGGDRLIPLREALKVMNISVKTYYRRPELLPPPIKTGGRLKFFKAEIEARLVAMAASREAAQ